MRSHRRIIATATTTAAAAATTITLTIPTSQINPIRQALIPVRDILLNRHIPALPALDIQSLEIVRHEEEHITALIQALESLGIVWELVLGVCGRGVAQEDALHLTGVLVRHGGVVAHDVRVGGVGDEDEFALGEGLEDFFEEEFADGKGGGDVGEV